MRAARYSDASCARVRELPSCGVHAFLSCNVLYPCMISGSQVLVPPPRPTLSFSHYRSRICARHRIHRPLWLGARRAQTLAAAALDLETSSETRYAPAPFARTHFRPRPVRTHRSSAAPAVGSIAGFALSRSLAAGWRARLLELRRCPCCSVFCSVANC